VGCGIREKWGGSVPDARQGRALFRSGGFVPSIQQSISRVRASRKTRKTLPNTRTKAEEWLVGSFGKKSGSREKKNCRKRESKADSRQRITKKTRRGEEDRIHDNEQKSGEASPEPIKNKKNHPKLTLGAPKGG